MHGICLILFWCYISCKTILYVLKKKVRNCVTWHAFKFILFLNSIHFYLVYIILIVGESITIVLFKEQSASMAINMPLENIWSMQIYYIPLWSASPKRGPGRCGPSRPRVVNSAKTPRKKKKKRNMMVFGGRFSMTSSCVFLIQPFILKISSNYYMKWSII